MGPRTMQLIARYPMPALYRANQHGHGVEWARAGDRGYIDKRKTLDKRISLSRVKVKGSLGPLVTTQHSHAGTQRTRESPCP